MTTLAERPALTATDRCDRCGAQAYVRVELTGGAELLFCAHHARAHEDQLRELRGLMDTLAQHVASIQDRGLDQLAERIAIAQASAPAADAGGSPRSGADAELLREAALDVEAIRRAIERAGGVYLFFTQPRRYDHRGYLYRWPQRLRPPSERPKQPQARPTVLGRHRPSVQRRNHARG